MSLPLLPPRPLLPARPDSAAPGTPGQFGLALREAVEEGRLERAGRGRFRAPQGAGTPAGR